MIDGIVKKGIWIIIPSIVQNQTLEQLHSSHMGIEK